MNTNRRYILLSVILALTALPATSAYLLYKITKNPTLQPLGLNHEELIEREGELNSVSILVRVDLGNNRTGGTTQEDMRKFISHIVSTHTDSFVIKFNEVPGDEVGVTLNVGRNSYGPFQPGQLAEGLHLALIALDMTKKAKG